MPPSATPASRRFIAWAGLAAGALRGPAVAARAAAQVAAAPSAGATGGVEGATAADRPSATGGRALGAEERAGRGGDPVDRVGFQLAGDGPLDLVEHLRLVGADQRERRAVGAHPTRPADPVDVVLGVL